MAGPLPIPTPPSRWHCHKKTLFLWLPLPMIEVAAKYGEIGHDDPDGQPAPQDGDTVPYRLYLQLTHL